MERRAFLEKFKHLAYLPFLVNGIPVEALCNNPLFRMASSAPNERVLVLVQLIGGNDGLNTILPLDQYAELVANRPQIVIPENKILKSGVHDKFGFHPSLKELFELFEQGEISVIQNVGMVEPNFSHFRATDIWLTGSDTNEIKNSGWLGRYLNNSYPNYPDGYPNEANPHPPAIQIGSMLSTVFRAEHFMMGYTLEASEINAQQRMESLNTPYSKEFAYVEEIYRQTNQYTVELEKALAKSSGLSQKYPGFGINPLSDQLRLVSRLIAGGIKSKIFLVSHDQFDTHSNQVDKSDATAGAHSQSLSNVSVAIDAFLDDCKLLGISDKVLGMTFSEFGRRVKANGSYGTDHGTAAPVFLFGTQLGEKVIGSTPKIPLKPDVAFNLPVEIDFRTVYANILRDWFEVAENEIGDIVTENGSRLHIISGLKEDFLKSEKSYITYSSTDIILHLSNSFKQTIELMVSDVNGKMVFKTSVLMVDHTIKFSTIGISKGLYLYAVSDGTNSASGKFYC